VAFNYSEFAVLWTFRHASPDKYNVNANDLKVWDSQLRTRYEDKLVAIMGEFGITLTRENKSRILSLAEVSNGTADGTRVRNACRFFVATRDLALDP
jgi:hypothetical protein